MVISLLHLLFFALLGLPFVCLEERTLLLHHWTSTASPVPSWFDVLLSLVVVFVLESISLRACSLRFSLFAAPRRAWCFFSVAFTDEASTLTSDPWWRLKLPMKCVLATFPCLCLDSLAWKDRSCLPLLMLLGFFLIWCHSPRENRVCCCKLSFSNLWWRKVCTWRLYWRALVLVIRESRRDQMILKWLATVRLLGNRPLQLFRTICWSCSWLCALSLVLLLCNLAQHCSSSRTSVLSSSGLASIFSFSVSWTTS